MNKKLIAIAIAGAMSAPFAANAGEATIYGAMDVSIDTFDNDDTTSSDDSSTAVSSNSSRIGFKGAEDLGGGMKAVWQVETGVNLGNGGSQWAGRNSFAGLAGGFGTFILGKHDTPYKTVGRKAELFGNGIGDSRALINGGHDLRTNNTMAYVSPNMGGLQAVLAYVTDADDTTNEDGELDAYSVSVSYSAGPVYVGLANQEISTTDLGASDDMSATRLAGTYKMGAAKVAALWQSEEAFGGADNMDRDVWGLGGAYTMGNNTIKAQFYSADEWDAVNDSDADMWAIGLDHAMSKQTKLYAAYTDMDNSDAANYHIGGAGTGHGDGGPSGILPGADPSAFSVGMQHKF